MSASRSVLTRADLASQTWSRIRAHLIARRDELRVDNDDFSLTELQTARVRARIAFCTELLELEKRNPVDDRRGDVTTLEALQGIAGDADASLD